MQKNNDKLLSYAIFGGLLGAILFVLLGQFGPFFYYQYYDKRDHYYINPNPLTVDGRDLPFETCGVVKYRGERFSDIDFATNTSIDLIRKDKTGGITQVYSSTNNLLNVEKGNVNLELEFLLPCNISEGKYYLSGIIQYEIWGAQKTYHWKSEEFNVVKAPIQETQK